MGVAQDFVDRADVKAEIEKELVRTLASWRGSSEVPEGGEEEVGFTHVDIEELNIIAEDEHIDEDDQSIAVEISGTGLAQGQYKVGGADTENQEDEREPEISFTFEGAVTIRVPMPSGELILGELFSPSEDIGAVELGLSDLSIDFDLNAAKKQQAAEDEITRMLDDEADDDADDKDKDGV